MYYENELEREYIPKVERLFKQDLGFKILDTFEEIQLGVNYKPDHNFSIKVGNYTVPVMVEIKGDLSHLSQIKKFMSLANGLDGISLLVAPSISEKIKERLRRDNVGFYEVDREVFIPFDFILNSNRERGASRAIKVKGFRAESNLKMLLYLISKPEALKYTQRELGERLDLSLGAVNKALKNLEIAKIIITRGRDRYFGRFDEIVDRWRMAFRDFETREHHLGRFSPMHENFYSDWKRNLKSIDSYWGGEAAASIRTNYLTPELFSIYTYNDKLTPILKELRLKKDPKGCIGIMKCFWPEEINNNDGTAPDFVVLCELLNSGIDRNIETAEVLKKRLMKEMAKYEY